MTKLNTFIFMQSHEVHNEKSFNYALIQNREEWLKNLPLLKKSAKLAIDIEASTTRGEPNEICLIQLSTPTHDFLLDTIARFDFSELRNILENPRIEKIFHACEFDLRLLWTQYQWRVVNLFDTMWAGKILGYKQLGLAYFLDYFLNIKQDKRYQKSDWKHRPLTKEQLDYAFKDAHYLINLADILKRELISKNLLAEAKELFSEIALDITQNGSDPTIEFWKIIGNKKLPKTTQVILMNLLIFRENLGKQLNCEPKSLISNKSLLKIACHPPTNKNDLKNVQGIHHIINLGKVDELLLVLNVEDLEQEMTIPPKPEINNPKVINRINYLLLWRKKHAQARQVDADVILSKNKINTIALNGPYTMGELKKLNVLGPIRYKKYAEQIVSVIKSADSKYEETEGYI